QLPPPGVAAGPKFRALPTRPKTYPAPDSGAGAGLRGAPPTETGPKGLGNRDAFLRDASWGRAFGRGIEEVVSGVIAFCRESTRAISEGGGLIFFFRSAV